MHSKDGIEQKQFFNTLYNQHFDKVYAMVCANCFSPIKEDREDCVSETFIIAMEKYDILKNHPNQVGYLLTIAKNVTFNFNTRYNKTLIRQCALEDDTPTNGSVEDHVENQLIQEHLKNINIYKIIANSLSKEEQELYFLHYIEHMPLKDIATLLNSKYITIRVRASRLRVTIMNIIKQHIQ